MGTLRESIAAALREGPATALELSRRLRRSEADILGEIPHVERSLPHGGERLHITPASCRKCGHSFEDRTRVSKPSRCPECRGEWIEPPTFEVVRVDPI